MRSVSVLTSLWLSVAAVDAYTCSNAEEQSIYGLYQAAAARSGCAPYVTPYGSGIKINWTCSTTSCTPTMQQLASQLPYCDSTSTGKSFRSELENALYTQCKLCSFTQQEQISSLWAAAAKTSSCSPYATSSGSSTFFSWPCSASGCTAVLKDLATKVPDCWSGGVNERSRILTGISTCTSVNPSPVTQPPSGGTPSPVTTSAGGGSGTCTASQVATSSSLWEAAAATSACSQYATVTGSTVSITWPCSKTSCTGVMKELAADLPNCVLEGATESEKDQLRDSVKTCTSSVGGGDNDTSGNDATSTPSSTAPTPTPSYSSDSCSTTDVTTMAELYVKVATSTDCESYSDVYTYALSITAPCSSKCVTVGFQRLADLLPDCYYSYSLANKKVEVDKALARCASGTWRRRLLTSSDYSVTVNFGSPTKIYEGDKSSQKTASPSPGMVSGGPRQREMGAGVVLVTIATVYGLGLAVVGM